MNNLINLKIITPNKVFFEKQVDIVTCTTSEGQIGIQANHSAFKAYLEISELIIGSKNSQIHEVCAIGGGIINVEKNYVTIITEDIQMRQDINLDMEEKIKKILEDKLKEDLSEKNEKLITVKLAKVLNAIKVKGGE